MPAASRQPRNPDSQVEVEVQGTGDLRPATADWTISTPLAHRVGDPWVDPHLGALAPTSGAADCYTLKLPNLH